MHPSQAVCEQHRNAAKLQTCACQKCQPSLHTKIHHRADLQPYHHLRGLTWRSHDAWHIACLAVSWFTNVPRPRALANSTKWHAWVKKYQAYGSQLVAAKNLDESALNEVIDIFSDIFLMGQLPSSKIQVRWADLAKNQLGCLEPQSSPQQPMILWLNFNHAPLICSSRKILCVVLHEMGHAFFDYYACWPWNDLRCAEGPCGKLYQLNMGLTGHGRAWQHLMKGIQREMRPIVGFSDDLGRVVGMYEELDAGACIPCRRDAKSLYPWSSNRWWSWTMRTKDDDALMYFGLRRKTPRNRACDSNVSRHERRNSI